jgi:CPA2 family monovalent cation:H+ antiporter-2
VGIPSSPTPMPPLPYLRDIVVLLGTALVVLSASHRLRLSPVIGFLLTGLIVGPHGLALVRDPHHVEILAELGVVFLLFVTGLEVSTRTLRRLLRVLLAGGGLQVVTTAAASAGVLLLLGYAPNASVFFGFVVALSSTAVVIKMLLERRELDSPHGRLSVGILLFQDFLIVPLLLVTPLLAGGAPAAPLDFAVRFGGGLLVVAGAFAAGRYLVPRLLQYIVRTRIRELLVIVSLFSCLGAARLTETLGFSVALGAFLAGVLIADTEYGHQVHAEIEPFRDLFNGLFFIAVGMLLSLEFAAANAGLLVAVAVAIVLLKTACALAATVPLGYPFRVNLVAAVGLAQIGEFSFVLVAAGRTHGLVDEWHYQVAVAAAVLSILATPGLFGLGTRLRFAGAGRLPASGPLPQEAAAAQAGRVVIAGFGPGGRQVARALRQAGTDYVVIEMNPNTVSAARREGEPILYGDASRRAILERCGIAGARAVVFTVSDPRALRQGIRMARHLGGSVYILARARYEEEIEELRGCGADEVVTEEFETSIEVARRILTRLGVPPNVVRAQTRALREGGYRRLRDPGAPAPLPDRVAEILESGTTEVFLLLDEHVAVGRTIREIELRKRTGATVMGVVREGRAHPNPSPDLLLEAGDLVVLLGRPEEIQRAVARLEGRDGS